MIQEKPPVLHQYLEACLFNSLGLSHAMWHIFQLPAFSFQAAPLTTSKQQPNSGPVTSYAVFMKIIGHIRNFRWLGPNVWWGIIQIWIEYIKPIEQMSDESWKFFRYIAYGDIDHVDVGQHWFRQWLVTWPSHYLNLCWLIIKCVVWHSSESNFTSAQVTILYNEFENHTFKIITFSGTKELMKLNRWWVSK